MLTGDSSRQSLNRYWEIVVCRWLETISTSVHWNERYACYRDQWLISCSTKGICYGALPTFSELLVVAVPTEYCTTGTVCTDNLYVSLDMGTWSIPRLGGLAKVGEASQNGLAGMNHNWSCSFLALECFDGLDRDGDDPLSERFSLCYSVTNTDPWVTHIRPIQCWGSHSLLFSPGWTFSCQWSWLLREKRRGNVYHYGETVMQYDALWNCCRRGKTK